MKYGFVYPGGGVQQAVEFGVAAEQSGWDAFFVWDPVWGVDPWVTLAAIAIQTEHIRLGTMISPLSRRRPWKVASETATLDNLSNGRVILAVGLGAIETGFEAFGEVTDRKTRAELLDESLDIISGLWHGQPFNYSGKHYQVSETDFSVPAPPVQQPRIPVWVVGAWPRQKSMRRVLRWDGLLPNKLDKEGEHQSVQPDDLRDMKAYIEVNKQHGGRFDYVIEGETDGDDGASVQATLQPWVEAGATWWIEARWNETDPGKVLRRLEQGPPRPAG